MLTNRLIRPKTDTQPMPWEVLSPPIEQSISAAIAHLNARRPAEAVRCLAGLRPDPAFGHPHASLAGRVLMVAGSYPSALDWFDAALAAHPDAADTLVHRADALAKLDRLAEAAEAYEDALRAGTQDPVAYYNHGAVLGRLGRHDEALVAYDAALKCQPAYPEGWRAAAATLRELGDIDNALVFFDQAIALQPAYLDAILDRANLLHALDHYAEALAAYDAALEHLPVEALLWNNRSIVLHDLGRMDDARDSAETALSLDPLLAPAHSNLANVLFRLGAYEEAMASCERALAIRPGYPEALCCRGLAQKMLGRFADALASFEAALDTDPDFIHARANRGELRLLLGQFGTGWADYEFRFYTERQKKPALNRPVPEWQGEHKPGDRIVVITDQGNGDAIQFARFLPHLVARRAIVTFVCPKRLQRLLQGVTGGVQVREAVGDDETFEYQIALSSLPGAFKTTLRTLEASRPYLEADPARIERWAAEIGDAGFKIGLCWRGSQNWQCDPQRSLPLRALEPLARVPGVRLLSLQMPDNSDAHPAMPVESFGAGFDAGPDAFVDTAAAMMSLDLIVTCDTAVAHLAGALGRPVWLLLQAVPEWRWMLGRSTSPWYPTMRLFRQTRAGDWTAPVEAIAQELWTDAARRIAAAA